MKPLQRLIFLILSGLLAVTTFVSCERPGNVEKGGSFSGYVYDSNTTLPIDSAMISVNDSTAATFYSDSTGYFKGVRNGSNVTLYVRKEGYLTQSTMIELSDNRSDLVFNLVPNN